MKILLVSAIPPPEGGVATWTQKYLDYCKRNSYEIVLVNIALQGRRGKQINTKRHIIDEIKRTLSIIKDMNNSLKDTNIQLVHINSSCSKFGIMRDYCCALLAKKRKVPIVLHCHCNVGDQITWEFGKKIFQKVVNISSRVIVLNSSSYNYLKKICKMESDIVPNFIEKKAICENRVMNDHISEVVFVGHVQKTKGCIEIIEVAKRLRHIHFSLVGPVSDEIKNRDIPPNLSLVGPVASNQVEQYLSSADLYLFPSYTEGFSLSLAEAMANGLPCIATDVGANRDMLEENGGIIVKVGDVESIIDAIEKIQSIEKRQCISEWNKKKVKSQYVIDSVMDRIYSIYEEVISR